MQQIHQWRLKNDSYSNLITRTHFPDSNYDLKLLIVDLFLNNFNISNYIILYYSNILNFILYEYLFYNNNNENSNIIINKLY